MRVLTGILAYGAILMIAFIIIIQEQIKRRKENRSKQDIKFD